MDSAHTQSHITYALPCCGGTASLSQHSVTHTHGLNSVVINRNWILEADLATCHRVAQLGLIVDEGHDAQIGLDEQGSLQDQDTVSSTWDRVLLMGFLHCLNQLGPEVVQLCIQKKENDTRQPLFKDFITFLFPLINLFL